VYFSPQSESNELVQYAQSSSTDMKVALDDVREIALEHEGTDVLYYGGEFDNQNESDNDQPYAGEGWFERLPIAWYTETWKYNAEDPDSIAVNSTAWAAGVENSDAPVVIALAEREDDEVVCESDEIEEYLEGYRRYCGKRYLYDGGTVATVVVFVDGDWLDRVENPGDVYERIRYDADTGTEPKRNRTPPVDPVP
jgi:predicted membrane-bound mannosyltransferase